jgi:pilus assembly protein Flp/PilA
LDELKDSGRKTAGLGWCCTKSIYEDLVMTKFMKRFMDNESGATAIEYGLIAAGISVAIVGVVGTIGGDVLAIFNAIDTALVAPT